MSHTAIYTPDVIITTPDRSVLINAGGQPGPPGPEGGTPIVAVPYDQWPPVNPQQDTLYLRLAP